MPTLAQSLLLGLLAGLTALGMACAGPAAPSPPPQPTPLTTPTGAAAPGTPVATATVASPVPSVAPTGTPAPAAATPPGTPSAGVPVPRGTEGVVEAAKKDLAQRAGVGESEIAVVRVSEADWPDTALGCPKPGMAYAQVITPGYRLVLAARGQEYEYHSDRRGNVVAC